jgi:hypothetical protein
MLHTLTVVALLAVISSCATKPSVSGRYALADSDVRQIQQLVDARSDIPKPIRDIHVDRANHAEVSTGNLTHRVGSGSLFTVAKRHGQWVIDSPVREEHIITP